MREEPCGSGIASGWQWLEADRSLRGSLLCACPAPLPAIHGSYWGQDAGLDELCRVLMLEINSPRYRDCPHSRLGVEITSEVVLTQSVPCPARRDLEKSILSGSFRTPTGFVTGSGLATSGGSWQVCPTKTLATCILCLFHLCQASMALPKLIFLHPSQLCWPHFWKPVHSFSTAVASSSFQVVLQFCSASWWSRFPSSLQWWSVTGEAMTALVRQICFAPHLHLYHSMPLQTGMEMKSFLVKGLWERSLSELQCILLTGALFCLLLCSSTCAVLPLKEPHLAWSH